MDIAEAPRLDRRVQRTRQLLRDSLMALILEQGYESVTIQDITDRANLGRATFYLHFKDKDDLLMSSLLEVYEGLLTRFEVGEFGQMVKNNLTNLKAFEHAAQNAQLYRVLLREPGTVSIRRRIHDFIAKVVRDHYNAVLPHMNPTAAAELPAELIGEHIAGSLLALIEWWIEHDMPYSAEYMARVAREMGGQALYAYLATLPTDPDHQQNSPL